MLKIVEQNPGGKGSIVSAMRWIDRFGEYASDARNLWPDLEPDVEKSVKYEFSDANPNDWKPLSVNYLRWKRRMGFPDTIGVATGTLKMAATDQAVKDHTAQRMRWSVNTTVQNAFEHVSVGEYAYKFHAKRPIFGKTKDFLKSTLREAVRKWVKRGKQVASTGH